jgi:hypothetical protein
VTKVVTKVKPSQANEAQAKADAEAAEARNLREKHDADGALSRSGFTRGFEEENGSSQANLLSCDWLLIHIPRDGHCLMHCFVRILQMRQPGHEIKGHLQMRVALAQYFEDHGNSLEVVDVGIFQCENIDSLRAGTDASGNMNYYGGIAECVAFSYRFAISLQVYAPETLADGYFPCRGGGPSDQAPEIMLLSFGWRIQFGKVCRSQGTDHWSRMISVHTSVPASGSIAPTQNCVVTDRDSNVHEAKVVRALQARVPRVGDMVYAYYLETPYGQPLGHFWATQVRLPEVVIIDGEELPGDAPGNNDPYNDVEAGFGHNEIYGVNDDNDREDDESSEGDGNGDNDDNDQEQVQGQKQAAGAYSEQQPSKVTEGRKVAGRKPKGGEEDATNWCHDTHVTFLKTVVARNPFVKQGCRISDKWGDIALDMAQSTRALGEFAVTARADALRIKFTRLKSYLKNFRQGGRSARQSGIASVR